DRSRSCRSPFTGRLPFLVSPHRSRLTNASGRIEFIISLIMDWSFASGCSPPRHLATQLPSATDRPVSLSDRDFHPTVGAYFQAHSRRTFGALEHHRRLGYLMRAQRSKTVRPLNALANVSSSADSRPAPAGKPCAIRVILIPSGRSRSAR